MAAHTPYKAPKQARSRRSLRRLLDAAESVFDKYGLEGATLPRIAREAGLSPASVYRRFRDKDALIRAVFTRTSEMNVEELAKEVDLEAVRKIGIRVFTSHWISGMLRGYGMRTGLIRAAMMYGQQHPRAAFVRRQKELELQNFRKMVDIFLLWRDEIRHPDPRSAVIYGAMIVAFAARELILFDQAEAFEGLVPVSNDHLEKELSRGFLRYLGADTD
ncbi:MAG: helix-turn-helix domain-containing protein [Candidatus Acidiferrales bacterium]